MQYATPHRAVNNVAGCNREAGMTSLGASTAIQREAKKYLWVAGD